MGGPGRAALTKFASSEDELSLQFNYSWRRVRAQTGTINGRRLANRRGDLSELVAVGICVWESKVRVIEEVEKPCSYRELGLLPLWQREGLLHVEVRVEVTWAAKLVTALSREIIGWVSKIGDVIAWIGDQLCS